MSDDHIPEPSLLLASHEKAHREHLRHQHNKLHNRQTTAAAAAASTPVVTEVVETISVIQQIIVDSNGNTLSIITYLAPSTDNGSGWTLYSPASPSWTASAEPSQSDESAVASQSLPHVQSATITPAVTQPVPSSLAPVSNSTTLISGTSSSSYSFTNSTLSSKSPLTYLTSSSSSSADYSSITSLSSSTLQPTTASSVEFPVGGTGVAPGPATSSAVAAGNGSDSSSGSTPSTPVVVGGVVGSIAGAAVILLVLIYLIKWKKRNGAQLSLGSGRDGDGDGGDRAVGGAPSGGMLERRSLAYAVPAAWASLTGYKRSSQKTDRTVSSTAGSEPGFYRVSGRKLPSVLQMGGDGYGGGIRDAHTLSESSIYRDSQGFHGGPGTPSFPTTDVQRDSGCTSNATKSRENACH